MLNSLKSDYPTYEKLLFFKSPGKRQSRSMCRDCRAKTEIIPRKEKKCPEAGKGVERALRTQCEEGYRRKQIVDKI